MSIGSPTRSRRISQAASAEDHHLRRARDASRPGRRDQARAAADRRRDPFLICNTDAFWIEGPRSNIAPPRRGVRSRARWTSCSWSRRARERSASTGRATSRWTTTDGSCRASRAMSRRSSTPASGSSSRSCSPSEPAEVFRLAPFFHAAAAEGRLHGRPPRRPLGACRAAGGDRRGRASDRPVDFMICIGFSDKVGAQ